MDPRVHSPAKRCPHFVLHWCLSDRLLFKRSLPKTADYPAGMCKAHSATAAAANILVQETIEQITNTQSSSWGPLPSFGGIQKYVKRKVSAHVTFCLVFPPLSLLQPRPLSSLLLTPLHSFKPNTQPNRPPQRNSQCMNRQNPFRSASPPCPHWPAFLPSFLHILTRSLPLGRPPLPPPMTPIRAPPLPPRPPSCSNKLTMSLASCSRTYVERAVLPCSLFFFFY